MLIRSRSRNRARGGGSSLDNALLTLASYGASDAWDFIADQYIRNGTVGPSGITFTRASVGSYLNNDNTMTVFSSGQPRIGDKGILIEGSRQNLFLNSAVGATQSITVTAVAHTLSFFGTGTVTLSGVSTAGPLVGTGEFNRVSLTFTPTAGSLTLTVSGDIKWVNLELGSFPTSWIPSDGTAVTRAADVPTAVPTSGTDYPLSLFAEFQRVVDTGGFQFVHALSVGTAETNRAVNFVGSGDLITVFVSSGGAAQAEFTIAGTIAVNTVYKVATRVATNSVQMARGGTLGTEDTVVVVPQTPDRLSIGINANGGSPLFGYIRRCAIFNTALSNAELQGITT
jgi:hypothetical protein